MPYTIGKTYIFDSAHFIDGHPKCGKIHGHTWKLTVMVESVDLPKTGMLIDFNILNGIVRPLIEVLDHKIINDALQADPTISVITAETLAKWFHDKFRPHIAKLFSTGRWKLTCRLQEGEGGWAEFTE